MFAGDFVKWTWETPSYMTDLGYAVHQTENAEDLVNMAGGFSSGDKTRRGK